MQVIVRDRRQGKTTELVKWLLRGERNHLSYPHWSRVIVAAHRNAVVFTTNMVQEKITALGEAYLCSVSGPHMHEEDDGREQHQRTRAVIAKAVWSLNDLEHNLHGSREYEYALDDADYLLSGGLVRYIAGRQPAVITMTGDLVDHLRD